MNFRILPCALLAFAATAWAQEEQTEPQAQLPLDDLRTFTRVYSHIRNAYVEEISDKELLEYAIKGMLSELDPHSTYLDASSFDDLQVNTTGEYGGLGIEVGMERGFVKVISPIDDTPASRAGIESGDLIIAIDDKPVKGLSLNEAIELMRGPIGTDVIISVIRETVDQPFDVTLTRDTVKVRSVRSRMIEPGIGYLRIAQFQVSTGDDVLSEIAKLKDNEEELEGLILDLRNNPGGILQASVQVADAFLEEGLVVYTKGRIDNADIEYSAKPGDKINGLPLIVLINSGSASASEIVAGALQDHSRAIIMGTDSFGKGSVQTVLPITDDRAIKLTTALYFTPNGRSIQAQGIVPDIKVERAKITSLRQETFTEADLRGHLDNANGGEESDSESRLENAPETTLAERDNQLFEAVNLLKGLTIFNNRTQATGHWVKSES
ncbi:S41 family peptidase [Sessilibacter corallicola]|uniref:Proteolytic complex protein CptA n=1 Tax=Sessilibacter corallicola TaxID=2904075 RepID=A0ABQ0A5T3_9GAMM|nr:S41 family peptidase [Sessilibacter corallicola]MCE2027792.1 S41 family peptidase [Sessilibacter corallicola]